MALAPPGLTRVFYVDDGSTAIDAAVKMCAQGWRQLGAQKKTRFVALDGAYHGDTVGAVEPRRGRRVPPALRGRHVRVRARALPRAAGAYERAFAAMATLLRDEADTIAAVFVEPMVQGAGGDAHVRRRVPAELRALCDAHDVWLVADEVFTGYGRTGPMWAASTPASRRT